MHRTFPALCLAALSVLPLACAPPPADQPPAKPAGTKILDPASLKVEDRGKLSAEYTYQVVSHPFQSTFIVSAHYQGSRPVAVVSIEGLNPRSYRKGDSADFVTGLDLEVTGYIDSEQTGRRGYLLKLRGGSP